jgi:hypothetical protein
MASVAPVRGHEEEQHRCPAEGGTTQRSFKLLPVSLDPGQVLWAQAMVGGAARSPPKRPRDEFSGGRGLLSIRVAGRPTRRALQLALGRIPRLRRERAAALAETPAMVRYQTAVAVHGSYIQIVTEADERDHDGFRGVPLLRPGARSIWWAASICVELLERPCRHRCPFLAAKGG